MEAAQAWWEEEYAALDEDVEEFSAAVTHRRLGDALDVVKRRSGLIVSVVVPALVLLWWPGAAAESSGAAGRGDAGRAAEPRRVIVIGIAARVVLQNPRLLPFFVLAIIRQVAPGAGTLAAGRGTRARAPRTASAGARARRAAAEKHAQQARERRRRGGP